MIDREKIVEIGELIAMRERLVAARRHLEGLRTELPDDPLCRVSHALAILRGIEGAGTGSDDEGGRAPDRDVHTEHCCVRHGCKYGDAKCTVTTGAKQQSYLCEWCRVPEGR